MTRQPWTMICLATIAICCACTTSDQSKRDHHAPTQKPASPEIDGRYLASLESNISAFPRTTSILIMHRGKLVYERYFGQGSPELLNDTRSATKSLTAIVAGIVADKHRLELSSPAFKYLRSHAPFDNNTALKRQITIADLLTMSSALDCDDSTQSPGNEDNMHPQRHWVEWATNLPTEPGYTRDEDGLGRFSYCTAGSMLLGQIMANVSGQNLNDLFAQALFTPLGITRWRFTRSPSGEYMTGGGLRLRSIDLARIAQMLVDDGNFRGKRVISKTWRDKLLAPRLRVNEHQEYGYQFWSRTWNSRCGSIKASYMAGNGGNAIVILPNIRAVFVITRMHYGGKGMHDQTIRIVEDYLLNAILCQDGL